MKMTPKNSLFGPFSSAIVIMLQRHWLHENHHCKEFIGVICIDIFCHDATTNSWCPMPLATLPPIVVMPQLPPGSAACAKEEEKPQQEKVWQRKTKSKQQLTCAKEKQSTCVMAPPGTSHHNQQATCKQVFQRKEARCYLHLMIGDAKTETTINLWEKSKWKTKTTINLCHGCKMPSGAAKN